MIDDVKTTRFNIAEFLEEHSDIIFLNKKGNVSDLDGSEIFIGSELFRIV